MREFLGVGTDKIQSKPIRSSLRSADPYLSIYCCHCPGNLRQIAKQPERRLLDWLAGGLPGLVERPEPFVCRDPLFGLNFRRL